MSRKFMMLTLLISGPNQPGNNIDVYLAPLIADLKLLWETGVKTFDAYKKEYFNLRAILLWTINDFPAYGNLSGCVTKGYYACPICSENTCSQWLPKSKKVCFLGHRRFLPLEHPFHKRKKDFNNQQENDIIKNPLSGEEIYDSLTGFKNTWGKKKKTKKETSRKQKSRKQTSKKETPKKKTSKKKKESIDERACFGSGRAHFVVDPKSRKQTIQSIGTKWRNFKHTLYRDYIETQKDDPEEKKSLLNPPLKYPFLKKEDWKLFVAQRTSKQWEETSKKAKKVRAHHKYNHHLSRKGYARLTTEIMQETGLEEEEIDRAMLWKRARELKIGGFDSDVQVVVDRIDKLKESDSGEGTCGTHDVLTQALGTDEQRGHVRGMGKFVTPQQYFYLPNTVKHYMDTEKKKYDKRLNKLEDELEKLKKGVNNASEAESCQWGNEDLEDNPDEEPLDMSCFLAVDNASNIVAKGTILMDTNEEEFLRVMLEICLHREALLPVPLEEEFIMEVGDAIGQILSWPRHLVIPCSDLEKMLAKPKTKPVKDLKSNKQIKQLRGTNEENEKELEQKIVQVEKVTGKEVISEKEKKNGKENLKWKMKKRMYK
ncbi:hypothetical protein HanXRQr2_Chr08g0355831 [Helianthus annuus]|uniref:Transposase, Ptta/En/Spm, plant n=1 Tax=Helianthus annuus TaxID=4232 RepID=A0A9K3IGU8_HELAN|nr:hypothetical protein HanXRQr2_Chr08g0355831 [Helianthus annuus]